jgi:hypothetical protein
MATTASTWLMTEAQSQGRGFYQRDIIGDVPYGIVSGTEKRDVSEQLDLLAIADTPFINRIGWGPESGGHSIEWISEDLGAMKLRQLSDTASEWASFVVTTVDGMAGSDTLYQINQGTVLYKFLSQQAGASGGGHVLAVVTSTPAHGGTGVSVTISIITAGHDASLLSTTCSIDSGELWYVIGNFANEGSIPKPPRPRQRVVTSNSFGILRQDVQITGTMKATDMYVIGREDQHQVTMRMKELARERERVALYAARITKTSAMAGVPDGVLGFLAQQSGTHIDTTTTSLQETNINNITNFLWDYGANSLTFYGSINQTAKFTQIDKNRIRARRNDRGGGGYITSYLTESGLEIDLVPMRLVPNNLAFLIDDSKCSLIPKRGRKGFMEKLGKMGDFDDWQIISEFSFKMYGYNLRQHGMLTRLT